MKKFIVFALVALVLFCACGKNKDDGFNLLVIPDGTPLSILDTECYDVLPYERDNADVERLIKNINKLKPEDVTGVDFVDYKDDTPFVCIYIERENIYIFKVFSMEDSMCAATLCMVGTDRNIYDLEFEDEEIAGLIKKIYTEFEEKQ